jgi:hypothetical protein
MKRLEVTYGQLDRVLRFLGFTRRFIAKEPPAVLYEHNETGALISFPPFNEDETVSRLRLSTARAVLEMFDLLDPLAFGAELQKAKMAT